ncbi:hypothetical protein [Enterovibrio makurazakiensis]
MTSHVSLTAIFEALAAMLGLFRFCDVAHFNEKFIVIAMNSTQ